MTFLHKCNRLAFKRYLLRIPQIPLDPLVWRKDLDPSIKVKLYKVLLGYGRFGTTEENTTARQILDKLLWAPFHPSSDGQLATVRMLEATKKLVAIRDNGKLPTGEKTKRIAEAIAKIGQLGEERTKLADDPVQKQVDAFNARTISLGCINVPGSS
jgi:phosphonate transport system substrate-binding protein